VRWLVLAVLALPALGQSDDLLRRADKLQRDKPTPARSLGLLELRRATGAKLELPRTPADLPKPSPARDALLEATAWRAIPVQPADRPALDAFLTAWSRSGGRSPWIGVLRLYAAAAAADRAALIAAAAALAEVPTAYPTVAAEQAHFDLLKELGLDDNSAGLDVIAHRSFAPLHALLELDRALTRDVDFLQGTSRAADARTLRACRDRLRQAWHDASRHRVERLVALHVAGRTQDTDAVLFAARELPYLTDPAELARVLARLDKSQAWSLLISPLLSGEMQLIVSPPKLPVAGSAVPSAGTLTIEAKSKSAQPGISTYDGAVRVRAGPVELTCDKLAVLGDSTAAARILSGVGHVSIKSAAGHDLVLADQFTLNLDTGAYSLGGNVRLTREGRTQKLRAATIGRAGDVRDAVSLLDDFDAAPDAAARLALLPKLTNTYTDDELPPAARYVLALTLLRPHLAWEPADAALPVPLPPFLREDAAAQTRGGAAAAATAVEGALQRDAPARFNVSVRSATHPDVRRAAKLLESVVEGECAAAAAWWGERLRAARAG
jgi:hypothetical protein